MGNPLSYYNGFSYTFTWTQGRRLATAVKGSTTASFTYNESGIRTSKTVNGITHEYVVDGTKIISDCWLDSAVRHYIAYIYDAKGVIGMVYRNHTMDEDEFEYYIFEKNLQGDIVAIYNSNGTKIGTYTYDAWGNFTITSSATGLERQIVYEINPFRYRSYYYDVETGWYYLQSRYYNPEWGRFLNADGQLNSGLIGSNLFVYCNNNPVLLVDFDGNVPKWVIGSLAVAVGALAAVTLIVALPAAACYMGAVAATYIGSTAATIAVGATYVVGTTAAVVSGAYIADAFYTAQTGETVLKDAMGEEAYQAVGMLSVIATFVISSAASQGYGHGVCFVAGTLIQTQEGSLPIEDIEIGMLVYAHDPNTGETALKKVVDTFVRESDELVHVVVNEEHIITTPTHPFYVPKKGWIDAIDLRAGDRLQLLNGEYVVVEYIQYELLEYPVTVYNFEVEDFHTYFVGKQKLLVHNMCKKAQVKNPSKSESTVWKGLENFKNGLKTSGTGKNQRFYSWDYLHNEIEVFDRFGKHIGVMDPTTGEMIKGAVKGRRIGT